MPPAVLALDLFDTLPQILVTPPGKAPLHLRFPLHLAQRGAADDVPYFIGSDEELCIAERHLQVVDGAATAALAVATPQAAFGVHAEAIVGSVVNGAGAAPFPASLLQFGKAGSVIEGYFRGTEITCGVRRDATHHAASFVDCPADSNHFMNA